MVMKKKGSCSGYVEKGQSTISVERWLEREAYRRGMNGIGIRKSIVRTTIEVCWNEKMDGSKWLVHGKGVLDEGENESGSMYV